MNSQFQKFICVIGLAGPIKAGKSSVARILCEMAGFSRLSFGQLVLEQLNTLGVIPNREQLQETGTQMIRELGYEGITDLLLRKIDRNPLQVIEGVRHTGVDSYLRNRFKDVFKLVYVDCPFEIRLQRAQAEKPWLTAEVFHSQDEAPIETGARVLRTLAEVILLNNKGPDELRERVRRLLR